MDLIKRALRLSLPQRIFGPRIVAVFDAVGANLQKAYDAAAAVIRESIPSRATDTLPLWYDQLGLRYDSTLTLTVRQGLARQAYVTIGGQNLVSLNAAIQIAFPNVYLDVILLDTGTMVGAGQVGIMQTTDYYGWYPGVTDGSAQIDFYRVLGNVENQQEFLALLNLLSRIAPAHMEAVTGQLVILNITPTSETGLAMVGLAEVGRTKEDI